MGTLIDKIRNFITSNLWRFSILKICFHLKCLSQDLYHTKLISLVLQEKRCHNICHTHQYSLLSAVTDNYSWFPSRRQLLYSWWPRLLVGKERPLRMLASKHRGHSTNRIHAVAKVIFSIMVWFFQSCRDFFSSKIIRSVQNWFWYWCEINYVRTFVFASIHLTRATHRQHLPKTLPLLVKSETYESLCG